MQQVEEPIETIHLYVVKEEPPRPSLFPVICSLFLLIALVAIGVLVPYQRPEERETLHVPAILLPIKTFHISVKVMPTGIKTHPATPAHGLLTITNGSILSEALPKGMIVTTSNGVEIVTDAAVVVPPGSATGYGFATVSAHTVLPGARGNIQPLAINQVEGTALYIRNLNPFTGGQNAYTTTFITTTDRETALNAARTRLRAHTSAGILSQPCIEAVTGNLTVHVTWACQFVTYHIPFYMHVTGVQVMGKSLLVAVVFVARPRLFPGK